MTPLGGLDLLPLPMRAAVGPAPFLDRYTQHKTTLDYFRIANSFRIAATANHLLLAAPTSLTKGSRVASTGKPPT